MSDLRAAVSRSTLLDNLYAAAETLLQAVADPLILDEAPLHHRAQALDVIGRFIDRIEKRVAQKQQEVEKEEAKEKEEIYLQFTYGADRRPLPEPGWRVKQRERDALQEARNADLPEVKSTECQSHTTSSPAPQRVSPDHVRALITPYTDPVAVFPFT